jgi:hypothetical protein
MAKATIIWITEQEAADMLGLDGKTLRLYCRHNGKDGSRKRRKYDVMTSKLSKTKVIYNKVDIDRHIAINATA